MTKRSPSVPPGPAGTKRTHLEASLPVADKYQEANRLIESSVERLLPSRMSPSASKLAAILQLICSNAPPDAHIKKVPNAGECKELMNNPDFVDTLKSAIKQQRYEDVMALPILRQEIHNTLGGEPASGASTGVQPGSTGAASLAWRRKYLGDCHEIMLRNINSMNRRADYASSVALIQSSGAGKSRMVDEQANLVFTIPFNLRDPVERASMPYPPEDTEVTRYLCNTSEVKNAHQGEARVALFFGHLFSNVTREVKEAFFKLPARGLSPGDLARHWRTHLLQNNKRSHLYARVVQECREDEAHLNDSDFSSILSNSGTQCAVLLDTLGKICNFPNSDNVRVMLYFDEAYELRHTIPGDKQGKTLYDVVWSSLSHFQIHPVFTIFLSTQTSLNLLAPSAKMARSARQKITKVLQGPITETPFDCHPAFPLQPGEFKLEDLGELHFLARFGRPLFWTLIEAAKGNEDIINDVMKLARIKLIHDNDIHQSKHTHTGMLATLDVLITIDYEPRGDSACEAEMEMVASHMRIAFSIPDHRLYIRSGYPSEPFIAEAASRQMYHYLQHGSSENRMISLLRRNLDHGLIDPGQKGEVVMRVLLRKAYMDAIVAEQATKSSHAPEPNFSTGCSFLQFLKSLFSNTFHTLILKSNPDNRVESHSSTLEDAFKHAIVRFTHFVKAVDDSIVESSAMVSGFLRGVAFICHNHQKDIDIIIPILLGKDRKLEESSMSALFIQVKRRKQAGSVNAYIIDQKMLGFFPEDASTTQRDNPRPYATLLAELGVHAPPSGFKAVNAGRSDTRTSPRHPESATEHARFSIRAYGCTDTTWKVIGAGEHDEYKHVLGTDEVFRDHPRQDQASQQHVRHMLPFWYRDVAWDAVPAEQAPKKKKKNRRSAAKKQQSKTQLQG